MPDIKILIVEDEIIIANHLKATLTSFGYLITGTCTTGEEALEAARQLTPNLILMDIRLQGAIDGIEAARQIREDLSIPIIFLTAYADEDLYKRAGEIQPFGYLIKPINDNTLIATLEMAWRMAKVQADKLKVEQELIQRDRWLNATFQQSAIGIIYLDLEGNFLRVNEKYCQIMGYDSHELYNMNFLQPTQPDYIEKLKHGHEELIANRSDSFHIIKKNLRKDQQEIWVDLSLSRVVNDNEPDYLIGIVKDISKQKTLEKQLQQAQKMEAIGTLAGGIAHDFNNILHPIIGFSKMGTKACKENEKLQSYFRVIYDAGIRAKLLIQQILTFSRQNELSLNPVLLQPIIKEALKLLRSTIPSTVEMKEDICNDQCLVRADVTQIHQVVMNLCTNAYHAIPDQIGTIEISYQQTVVDATMNEIPELSPGRYCCLKVTDSGQGIPPEILEKIFDPFFTTKDKDKGTGLGLSVVLGIVDIHNGHINVISSADAGTSISVYLPISENEPVTTVSRIETKEMKGKERILIVDDEENIVFFLSEALKQFGYQITGKTNGIEALAEFKKNPLAFDLVISDMTMPYLTGSQLAQQMLEIRADLPIIIVTGHNDKYDEEKINAIGVRKLLLKPIDHEVVALAIRNSLDK